VSVRQSIADLESWIEEMSMLMWKRLGKPQEQIHTTRMVPKRMDELLDGGSLYWVIKGQVACRQPLVDIRRFKDADGIGRCHLVIEPKVTSVDPRRAGRFRAGVIGRRKTLRRIRARRSAISGRCPRVCGGNCARLGCFEARF
jgi:hypothetical protein